MSTKIEKTGSPKTTRGGLVGPVLLIAIGVFFLLSNLGLITWDFWEAVGRLWPIVLIALGLDLLVGRRSLLGSALVVLVTIVMLGAGLFWLNLGGGRGEIVTGEVSQALDSATSAEVAIIFDVGRLQLDALPADSPFLVTGNLTYDERRADQVRQSYDKQGNVARYEIAAHGSSGNIPFGSRGEHNRWDLMLNRDVLMDLTIRTGVGTSELDLSLLNLSDLSINTGVGQTTIIMPGQGQVNGVINGGVGELIIQIPDGIAARIDVKTGLGSSQVTGDFEQNGSVYTSPGYETAVDRLDLELRAGIGQVTVRRLTGR
jgi:hypothetical protein